MSYKSEFPYGSLMDSMGVMQPVDFGDNGPSFIPAKEALEAAAPNLNQKVQEARLALAEVAIAIGKTTRQHFEGRLAFLPNTPTAIPGIDTTILTMLDGLDRLSSGEEGFAESERHLQQAVDVLDWFDAIDDGSAKHVIWRSVNSGVATQYKKEHHDVTHSYVRKVGDVYEVSVSNWKSDESHHGPKVRSATESYYFKRNNDNQLSDIVKIKAEDYEHLSSPLFSKDTALQPASTYQLSRELERFKTRYVGQQRMATTLSLLNALPFKKAKLALSLGADDRRRVISRRIVSLQDQTKAEVKLYGRWGETSTPTVIEIDDSRTNRSVTFDYDEKRVQVHNNYHLPHLDHETMISESFIDEVNDGLRKEVLKHEQ